MKTEEYDDFPRTKIPRVNSQGNAGFADLSENTLTMTIFKLTRLL